MKYLDSNVLLHPILYDEKEVKEVKPCKDLLLQIAKGKLYACSSLITWDEVVYIVKRTLGHKQATIQGKNLLAFPNLHLIAVDSKIITKSQNLIETYNIRPRDAIHAITALTYGNATIISYDKDFDKIETLIREEP